VQPARRPRLVEASVVSLDDDRTRIRHAIDESEEFDIGGEFVVALRLIVDRMPKIYAVRRGDKYLARSEVGKHELWVDSPAGSMYSTHQEASHRARRCTPHADVVTFVELPT